MTAVEGEPHLVWKIGRSRRFDQDALRTPLAELLGGPPILVAGSVVSWTVLAEIEPDDVVGTRLQVSYGGVVTPSSGPTRDRSNSRPTNGEI
jgi:hypothetical protein